MEIGAGIFLSSACIGLVALFGITKDRWNWKKIIKYGFYALLISFGLFISVILAIDKYNNKSIFASEFVIPNELLGISLGQSQSDVIFKLGKPNWIDPDREDYLIYTSPSVDIKITDGVVSHIVYTGKSYDAPELAGFSMYDSLDALKKKFGEPSSTYSSKDETQRIYNFREKNIGVRMAKGQIISFWVFDGQKYNGSQFSDI